MRGGATRFALDDRAPLSTIGELLHGSEGAELSDERRAQLLGRAAVVAAGEVVTRDVAPLTVVAGVPARAIRDLPEIDDA